MNALDLKREVRTPCTRAISHAGRVAHLKEVVQQMGGFSLPVSLDEAGVARLRQQRYLVGAKLDGTRYLLLLARYPAHLGGHNVAVLVNRAWGMYPLLVCADERLFAGGSLFDGELVDVPVEGAGRTRQVFYVFDALTVRGAALLREDYAQRFANVRRLFSCSCDPRQLYMPQEWRDVIASSVAKADRRIVCQGNAEYLAFSVRPWFNMRDVELVLRANLLASDGLVFMPVDDPVVLGIHPRMYKYKDVHTIDLVNVGGSLQYWDGQRMTSASVPTPEGKFMLVWTPTTTLPEGAVAEFRLTEKVGTMVLLQLVGVRTDKTRGNGVDTIVSVVHNFLHPVDLNVVTAACRGNPHSINLD